MIKKAVVLLSGGIDSSTALAIARSENYELYALSFDYGQRHRRELESAKMVSEHLGVKKHLVIKSDLREIGGSALTSDIKVPKQMRNAECGVRSDRIEKYINQKSGDIPHSEFRIPNSIIPVTYVPARNTIFLS